MNQQRRLTITKCCNCPLLGNGICKYPGVGAYQVTQAALNEAVRVGVGRPAKCPLRQSSLLISGDSNGNENRLRLPDRL